MFLKPSNGLYPPVDTYDWDEKLSFYQKTYGKNSATLNGYEFKRIYHDECGFNFWERVE